jgi:penicillin-binding protein 2
MRENRPTVRVPNIPREWYFYGVLALALATIVFQLYRVQIEAYQNYLDQAVENRTRIIADPAPRGVIYDRNGVLLARNLPSFNVVVTPALLPEDALAQEEIFRRLAEMLDMPFEVPGSTPLERCREGRGVRDLVQEQSGFQPFEPVEIKCAVDQETAFLIEQIRADMPGVDVIPAPVRDYPTGIAAANIIGYLGRIPNPEDSDYFAGLYDYYVNQLGLNAERDRIGVQGIEASQQDILAGQNGGVLVEEDGGRQALRVVEVLTPTVPGLNIQLTVDVRLQNAIRLSMEEWFDLIRRTPVQAGTVAPNLRSGVVIVMDPRTGEILAMVSLPTYDNNRFARGIDYDYYVSLAGEFDAAGNEIIPPDPDYPLLNHATQILYPPGSVFKIVTAAGAIQEGVIRPDQILTDEGRITIFNAYYPGDRSQARDFVCWTCRSSDRCNPHGEVDFRQGLAWSCNVFFYKIAGGWPDEGVEQGLGIDALNRWMRLFGFEDPTGVELPAEQTGIIPNSDWKRINIGENWASGDTLNASIGQGYVSVTPLQLLNAYNSLANGGRLLQPQIIDRYLDGEGNVITDTQPILIRDLVGEGHLDAENLQIIREGLRMTVTDPDGTLNIPSRYEFPLPVIDLPGIDVAGKTGTAEYCDRQAWLADLCVPGRWPSHAWTVLYAPADNPEVAVVAFVYNGTEGSIVAGPLANRALRLYYQLVRGVDFSTVEVTETPPEDPNATPTPPGPLEVAP